MDIHHPDFYSELNRANQDYEYHKYNPYVGGDSDGGDCGSDGGDRNAWDV